MSERTYAFRFLPECCIQCRACEAACKTWNRTEIGVNLRRFVSGFSGTYPVLRPVSLTISCLHCEDPACAAVCPVGAISKGENGAVRVDRDLCIGCRACLNVCPVHAPQFGADGLMQKCDLCGDGVPACVHACPTQALTLELVSLEEKASIDGESVARYE